ncbi:hypothetical protein Bca4012_062904 [Brassica carinata]
MVTFSKRRNGIYNKLSQLSILCGADVGCLIYSGSGKPFTFGSPSFDVVAQRFLHGNHHAGVINGEGCSSSSMIVDAHKKVKVDKFCQDINNMYETAHAPSLPVKSDASSKVDQRTTKRRNSCCRGLRSIMRNCVRLLMQGAVGDMMRLPHRRFLHMADG